MWDVRFRVAGLVFWLEHSEAPMSVSNLSPCCGTPKGRKSTYIVDL